MKNIVEQLKKESKSILSGLGVKAKSSSVIGLDLGTKSFRAVRIREGVKELPLKDTLIKDMSQLKDLSSQMKISDDERISINFTGETLTIKRVRIPSMPLNEIAEALKWELREQLHIEIDKVKIKYAILGEKEEEDGSKKIEIVAAVYNEADIEAKIRELKAIGLNVQSVVPSEFALAAYAVSQNLFSLDETVAIVDIGSFASVITVVEKGKVSFARSVAMGGDTITEAMTGTLVSDKGRIELSKDEAEKIKREQGISDDIRIVSMIRPILERLVTQIKRSMEYCESQFGSDPVKKIILAGNGARLKGLKEYLSKELELEVMEVLPEIAEAAGAALASGSKMNLLPDKFKEEKGREIKKVSLRMISIVVGMIFLFSYGLLSARTVNLKKELEIFKAHLETVREIREMRDKMVVLGSVVNTVSQGNIEAGSIMKELSNIIPGSTVLDSMLVKDTQPNIELSGVVLEEEGLSEFMSLIEASPMFEKVKLVVSEKNEDHAKGALDFEIVCNLTR